MAEEHLVGGHDTEEVVRVGDTVRRTRGPRSSFAAQVLRHLHSVGYPHAPHHLGVDEQGRDILTYIPGRTNAYALAGTMLRQLHEATADHSLAGEHECVIHGDPGPFNTIFHDGLPVAFIDWTELRDGYGDIEPEQLITAMTRQHKTTLLSALR